MEDMQKSTPVEGQDLEQEQVQEVASTLAVESDAGIASGEEEAEEQACLDEIHAHNRLVRAMDAALTDVRQRSYEGKLTTSARWKKLALEPEGMDAKEFEEELLTYIETHPHAEDEVVMGRLDAPKPLEVQLQGQEIDEDQPLPDLDVSDIATIFGKKAIYLYAASLMSHSFAHALFNSTEQDDISTFVDVVRTESRVYPRPVALDDFMNAPYLWPSSKTLDVFKRVQESEAFEDIHETRTSVGSRYYYSTLYLSDAQGKALAQWHGVDRGMNP